MSSPLLYIAGMGMITPLGPTVATTVAAVNAGISAYSLSDYDTFDGEPITMALVPNKVFDNFDADINEGDRFNARHDRLIKMAITAVREACAQQTTEHAIPVVLGASERMVEKDGLASFVENLQENCKPWVSAQLSRSLYSGRAASLDAIDFVFRYLYESAYPFVLVGASDSFMDDELLYPLAREQRLLMHGVADAYAPGEAASFLLLTRHAEFAQARNGQIIALHLPGMAEEDGHLYSDKPYRGEGLDQAFKKALRDQPAQSIQRIYSSMNGENHWAKEYGVAYLRNKEKFVEPITLEHPADCYGDLGSATATTLIALAAEHLHRDKKAQKHLVYSSSDFGKRGAIVVEKIQRNNEVELRI